MPTRKLSERVRTFVRAKKPRQDFVSWGCGPTAREDGSMARRSKMKVSSDVATALPGSLCGAALRGVPEWSCH